MFYFEEIKGKKILKSNLIKNAFAFFTTRESFLLTKEENQAQEILENREIISNYLNIKKNNLITPEQTHSTNIAIAETNKYYPNTDGLILTKKDIAIYLNFADCTPIIFYDEKQNIGAISHAGWRGTSGKIAALTVQKLVENFDSNTENIKVLIGPAICKNCYNVGEDVFEKLSKTINSNQEFYIKKDKEILVDLKEINKQQLIEQGILPKNIDVCPYCTCCNNNIFYSYRKENATPYRHNAILKLKND